MVMDDGLPVEKCVSLSACAEAGCVLMPVFDLTM